MTFGAGFKQRVGVQVPRGAPEGDGVASRRASTTSGRPNVADARSARSSGSRGIDRSPSHAGMRVRQLRWTFGEVLLRHAVRVVAADLAQSVAERPIGIGSYMRRDSLVPYPKCRRTTNNPCKGRD